MAIKDCRNCKHDHRKLFLIIYEGLLNHSNTRKIIRDNFICAGWSSPVNTPGSAPLSLTPHTDSSQFQLQKPPSGNKRGKRWFWKSQTAWAVQSPQLSEGTKLGTSSSRPEFLNFLVTIKKGRLGPPWLAVLLVLEIKYIILFFSLNYWPLNCICT